MQQDFKAIVRYHHSEAGLLTTRALQSGQQGFRQSALSIASYARIANLKHIIAPKFVQYRRSTMTHRFSIGQRVRLRAIRGAQLGSGSFKIVAALPIERAGEVRYRIKSEAESFERVADETNLSRTV
jgi:hypothetical protein